VIQIGSALFNELDVGGLIFIALRAYWRNSEGLADFYTFPHLILESWGAGHPVVFMVAQSCSQ
jgi:hypothetical protein